MASMLTSIGIYWDTYIDKSEASGKIWFNFKGVAFFFDWRASIDGIVGDVRIEDIEIIRTDPPVGFFEEAEVDLIHIEKKVIFIIWDFLRKSSRLFHDKFRKIRNIPDFTLIR